MAEDDSRKRKTTEAREFLRAISEAQEIQSRQQQNPVDEKKEEPREEDSSAAWLKVLRGPQKG